MKIKISYLFFLFVLLYNAKPLFSQPSDYLWVKSVGGSAHDISQSVTTDASGNTSNCSFTVTVVSTLSGSQTLTVCNGASVTVGTHVYSATGNYTDTILSAAGCDSIATMNLNEFDLRCRYFLSI